MVRRLEARLGAGRSTTFLGWGSISARGLGCPEEAVCLGLPTCDVGTRADILGGAVEIGTFIGV